VGSDAVVMGGLEGGGVEAAATAATAAATAALARAVTRTMAQVGGIAFGLGLKLQDGNQRG
jgi:hypothetical protein